MDSANPPRFTSLSHQTTLYNFLPLFAPTSPLLPISPLSSCRIARFRLNSKLLEVNQASVRRISMDSSVPAVRRPCFKVEDDGLASIAGRNGCHSAASTVVPRRRNSIRNLAVLTSSAAGLATYCSSPRSGRIFDTRFEEINSSTHFLDACNLCKKPLGGNRDIFMYRGDIPFCSEECRSEQIEADEAREKSLSLSAMKARRSKNKDSTSARQNGTASPSKSQKYPFRAGTVAAA